MPTNLSKPVSSRLAPASEGSVDKFIKTVRKRFAFSEAEEKMLVAHMHGSTEFKAGDLLVDQGKSITYSSLLYAGYACRVKTNAEGGRQIIEIQIPGDFIDLHSYPLERLDHTIVALTDCKIAKLYHDQIDDLIDKNPRFARILWFSTMVDASTHREWILNLGSRKGAARLAHLFCEMYCRMNLVGLVQGNLFDLPITQVELGDAIGFTPVHTHRVLQELQGAELVEFKNKRVKIYNFDRLAEFCGFEDGYLYLSRRKG